MNNIKGYKNAGFPALKYKPIEIKETNKQREYSLSYRHNINIKELLLDKNKSFVFEPKNNEVIEIINDL
jgi:hypothetical protein